MNAIAEEYTKNSLSYVYEPLPRNLYTTDADYEFNKFRKKLNEAFKYLDHDQSGAIDKEEFRSLMRIIGVQLSERELQKIISRVDYDDNGAIELIDLEKFLAEELHARHIIRCDMLANLTHPYRFVKYHPWRVTDRPLNFSLRPGANMLAAYLDHSKDPEMYKFVRNGYRLKYINDIRVDRANYTDIISTLDIIPLPYKIVFQTRNSIYQSKLHDKSGNFHSLGHCEPQNLHLYPGEINLFRRPTLNLTNLGISREKSQKHIHCYHDHCKHCPSEKSCYITLHLFMEDHHFSKGAHFLQYLILFLIFLSTFAYVFQTLPYWEHWSVWNVVEESVSILFALEFVLRLVSCRNVILYMKDMMNVVDFCACVPFWIELGTGGKETHLLRLIRVVRLLRLIRLARSRSLQEILGIFGNTFKDSVKWLYMFLVLYGVVMICFASFVYISEVGKETVEGICDVLSADYFCVNASISNSNTVENLRSPSMCLNYCEGFASTGCCSYDQEDGSCYFDRTAEISDSSSSDYISSGACRVEEDLVRSDGASTPFFSVTSSLWWACVSMTTIGYGEVYAITEMGRVVSAVATWVGMMFLIAPISVFGFHFALARISCHWHKVPDMMNEQLEAVQRESVTQLLESVNEGIGMKLFDPVDSIAFLSGDCQLNTKTKIEQILKYYSGWAYLPFAKHQIADLPRVSQFKLFTLFSIYGRKFQKKRIEHMKQDEKFFAGLQKLSDNRDASRFKSSGVESSSDLEEEAHGTSFVYGKAGSLNRGLSTMVILRSTNSIVI